MNINPNNYTIWQQLHSIMNDFSQKSVQAYDTQVKAKAKRKKVDK